MNDTTYQKGKDAGICVRCGGVLDRNGVLCTKCNQEQANESLGRYYFLKEINLCPKCGNTVGRDETYCAVCRAEAAEKSAKKRAALDKQKYNEYQRSRKHKLLEKGICPKCGKRKIDIGYKSCSYCRAKNTAYNKQLYQKKHAKNITGKTEKGLCYFCDKPVIPGKKVCEEHWKKCIRASYKKKSVIERLEKEGFKRNECGGNEKGTDMDPYSREVEKRIEYLCSRL